MRVKGRHPANLAEALIARSRCAVQVAAVISDGWGIHAWGWNSEGQDGYGIHAEAHALTRVNRKRLRHSTMWVAAVRRRSGNPVTARPCVSCQPLLKEVGKVMFRNGGGKWECLVR